MADEEFRRVLVWSGWLRFSHLCIGLSVIVLLLTGWLTAESPLLAEEAMDIHYLAASFLLFGLALRIVLMVFGQTNDRLMSLIPRRSELKAIGQTVLFYLSLGKRELPRWYGHNPLWKLVYLLIFTGLAIQILTGALMREQLLFYGLYLPSIHQFWAKTLLWISGLHILAVVLHDLKGRGSDISGIINGYRLFFVDRSQGAVTDDPSVQYVSMEGLKSNKGK